MANPKFNKEMKEKVTSTLPLAFQRPEDPLLGATLTSVLLKDGKAEIDEGLMHGRSDLEKGIKFTKKPHELPDAVRYHVAWVAMKGSERYLGVTVTDFYVDRPQRLGARDLSAQVNAMSRAISGSVELGDIGPQEKAALRRLLEERGKSLWEAAPEPLKTALTV